MMEQARDATEGSTFMETLGAAIERRSRRQRFAHLDAGEPPAHRARADRSKGQLSGEISLKTPESGQGLLVEATLACAHAVAGT
jgi:hypothetical protein